MSTRHNKRRGIKLSEHVQNVQQNTWLPPGSPAGESQDSHTEAQTTTQSGGEAYPAVTIMDEATHKAEEEKAAEERVKRAKAVSAPKNLSQQEILNMTVLLKLLPEGENVPLNTPIKLEDVPEELRKTFFSPGRNMADRNLVKLLKNPETGQYDALEITDIGFAVYQKKSNRLAAGAQQRKPREPREPRQRRSIPNGPFIEFTDDLRLKKLHESPRKPGTKGWYSWQLYDDGMNYKEYMAKKGYPAGATGFPDDWKTTKGHPFKGPSHEDWTWDLRHDFTRLYREGEKETLDDGSPNPNYWVNHFKE